MKKLYFITFLLILPVLSYSQDQGIYDQPETQQKKVIVPKVFIGPSIGINNISGMVGFLAEFNLAKKFTLAGGLGIGGWGYKTSICGRYYKNYPKGIFYGLGISAASGIKDYEIELAVEPDNKKQKVKMDLNWAYNVNLSIGYQFRLGRKARFNFELGYAVALNQEPYTVKDPNVILTTESKNQMKSVSPGGIIIGLAFTFGI